MSEDPNLVQAVLYKMARVFADDYDSLFRVVYEHTVQMIDALPIEPGDEIRNAFDHFALASRHAGEVDTIPSPPVLEIERFRERAWTNIEQARRHIVTGRFYCLEHQLRHLLNAITNYVRALNWTARSTVAGFQQRADVLAVRLPSAMTIDIAPSNVMAEIERQIAAMEAKVTEITDLLNDYMRLYLDVQATIEGASPPH